MKQKEVVIFVAKCLTNNKNKWVGQSETSTWTELEWRQEKVKKKIKKKNKISQDHTYK